MKKKRIVFINQNAGYLMIDIINAHREEYTERTFITGKITARNTPLDPDVRVERIVTYNRSSTVKRLCTWVWGFLQILVIIKRKYRNADLYIVSNPPLATLLPLFCRNSFYFLIFDVYPDALVQYNLIGEKSWLTRLWRSANVKIYKRASGIFTISKGMKGLLAQYETPERITVVPIWTDNNFLKPLPRNSNLFITKYSLQDKFVVMYSGNLGYTHDLEVLVDVAENVQHTNPGIQMVIVGEGEKKSVLEKMIHENKLSNILLLPWQHVEMLPHSLAACDLGVVSLGREASLLSVPSKTYNLMSVGAPLLCIADDRSELAALVHKYELGECFDSTEVEAITAFIVNLASDKAAHDLFKRRSLKASLDFSPENAVKLTVGLN